MSAFRRCCPRNHVDALVIHSYKECNNKRTLRVAMHVEMFKDPDRIQNSMKF